MKKFYLLIFLFVLLNDAAKAQKVEIKPAFTALVVANVDTSIAWYAKVLNLRVRNRVDNAERGFKQVILYNAECMIELVELTKAISQDSLLAEFPQGTRMLGINKFGFTVSDINAMYKNLNAKKVTFFGNMVTDPVSKKRTFLVTDPDGNLVQFFEK